MGAALPIERTSMVMTESLKKYTAILAYDGTAYHGWQAQKNLLSIETVLKNCFKKTFGKHLASLVAASRTDAGVHADGQVILFKYALDLNPDHIKKIMNDNLPSDIHFITIKNAAVHFHPWYNVVVKEYHYLMSNVRPRPYHSRFVAYVRGKMNIEKLKEALNIFVGIHDFVAFSTDVQPKDDICTVKTIDYIEVVYDHLYDAWRVIFKGKSFLRHMIRRIVGAAIFISQHESRSLDLIKMSLEFKKRMAEFPTASSNGLILKSIYYDKGL